jgi:MFS family permease
MLLNAMGGTPGGLLQSKYMQEVHGWTPANVSILILGGGAIGILGNVVVGNLSDQIGRRLLSVITLVAAPAMWTVFFNSSGDIMIASWVLSLFAQTAASTLLNAYSAELFPTSHRSTAESAIAVVGTLGGSAGLMLESWIYGRVGNHWRAVSLLMLASVAAAITVAVFFPETASVFVNLLINACEAMPDGGLIKRQRASRDGEVVVAIADQGCGIPSEMLTKIFDDSVTTKSSGSGWGLFMARELMRQLGGSIAAENRPKGGALFTLRFPLATSINRAD